jgi:hypothetical protein
MASAARDPEAEEGEGEGEGADAAERSRAAAGHGPAGCHDGVKVTEFSRYDGDRAA